VTVISGFLHFFYVNSHRNSITGSKVNFETFFSFRSEVRTAENRNGSIHSRNLSRFNTSRTYVREETHNFELIPPPRVTHSVNELDIEYDEKRSSRDSEVDDDNNMNEFETSPEFKSAYHMIKSNPFHPKNFFHLSKAGLLDSMDNAPESRASRSASTLSTAATIDDLDILPGITDLVHFDTSCTLGDGTDATVYELIDRRNCEHVAMKLTKRKSGRYRTEIHLLNTLKTCPFVVTLKNVLEDDGVYVLILEKAPMTLEALLYERCIANPMGEGFAVQIFHDICCGILAIHDLGFVHKDIKPENVLLFAVQNQKNDDQDTNPSRNGLRAKIADFGFATRASLPSNFTQNARINASEMNAIEWRERVSDRCGTPGFWAPELVANVVEMEYAFKMDVFSAGCLLYRMLCNEMPFALFDDWETKQGSDGTFKLSKVKPTFQIVSWIRNTLSQDTTSSISSFRRHWNENLTISASALDLLRCTLRIRPKKRFDIRMCLRHDWFRSV